MPATTPTSSYEVAIVIGIVVQFFWQTITTFVLFRMSKQDRSVEAAEKRLADQLDARLKAIQDRLDDGEEKFDGLGERDQQNELALMTKLDSIKDFIRANSASKADLDKHQGAMEHRLESMSKDLAQVGQDVAVLKATNAVAADGVKGKVRT